MSVDLRLRRALGPQPGGAVALVLGRTGGTLPPEPLPDPRPGALRVAARAPWRAAGRLPPQGLRAPWLTADGLGGAWVAPWAATRSLGTLAQTGWASTMMLPPARTTAPWFRTQSLGTATLAPWRRTAPLDAAWVAPWSHGTLAAGLVVTPWQAGAGSRRVVLAPWQAGVAARRWIAAGASPGEGAYRWTQAPWQTGRLIESIGGPVVPVVPPAPTPCWVPEPGDSVDLVLRLALRRLANLVLACRRAALTLVPIRRVYMVTNVTSLTRVSDGANIPCQGFSLSLDVDSWAWGFSASVLPDALALIEPDVDGTPVELAAEVNGTEFRVFAEAISRERTFGQASMRLQGRGITATLGAPYSPVSIFSAVSTLTSQQLVDQALPSGWAAAWGLTAWSVPGGIWSHQGTPISAAVAIAQAGGGYVQPHASLQQISVLPLYPSAPWDWGSVVPDIELPAAYATREGIEWLELPRYNRVYVSGTSAGVLGRVTRLGTAGDVLAPMVTDPLITHSDAARQRGLPILAKTGRVSYVSLRLPVAEGTGVIRPGQFVRYTDGGTVRLGLTRSVAVDVAGHQVWQTIKLETFS